MSLLDGIVGGAVGAGLVTATESLIEKNGGVQGLVDQFEKNGLGGVARSWVGNGTNQPVTGDQLQKVLGSDTIKAMADKAGMTPDELAAKLSSMLPGVVDKLTPNGAAH